MERIEDNARILAVDDDENGLFVLEQALLQHGFEVVTASSGNEALEKAFGERPDLILLDVNMPGPDGFEVTARLKQDAVLRFTPVVLLTAKDTLEDITHGLAQGADDYIRKPFQTDELIARIRAALRTRLLYRELQDTIFEKETLRRRVEGRAQYANIVGKSAVMQELFGVLEKVADAAIPVLITGESGTGKELVATALHYNGRRHEKPFIVQNCSAFSEHILESELFGHSRGAFTGALSDKRGLFEAADGGTFFLDEIGDMKPTLQARLLRVLQDGTFLPVGSTRQVKVNVRIVAATNRDLKEMVAKGEFREDLFYRLNVVNIRLPALRERREDIPLLVESFLKLHAARDAAPVRRIESNALQALTDYSWPGNIRELQNEIERVLVLSPAGEPISKALLSPHLLDVPKGEGDARRSEGKLKEAVEELERRMILQALEQNEWNKKKAAGVLGISRSSLIAKVQAYELERGERLES